MIVLSLLATATQSASIKRERATADADATAQINKRASKQAVNLVKDEELINFWNEEWEGQNEEISDAGKDVVLQLLRNISPMRSSPEVMTSFLRHNNNNKTRVSRTFGEKHDFFSRKL